MEPGLAGSGLHCLSAAGSQGLVVYSSSAQRYSRRARCSLLICSVRSINLVYLGESRLNSAVSSSARCLMVANSASRRSSWRSIFAISFAFLVFIIHSVLVVYRSANITSLFGTRKLIRKNIQHIKYSIFNKISVVYLFHSYCV